MREMAGHLGRVPRTIRRWRAAWHQNHLQTKPRGRPAATVEQSIRQAVIMCLAFLGPEVGIPTLEWIFPHVSRSVLTDLRQRYRRLARLELRSLLHVLIWHRVGAVWAADFAKPPLPIDGLYKRIFNVRDLASGEQLMAMPVYDETAATVIKMLEILLHWCGIPLVLKVDNGSAFIAHEVRDWARDHGIHLLYSPPQTPAYNGAIEAGTGSIETRAFHQAARHGRPWEWTCDDVASARLQANETARPRGRNGPTPDEAWTKLEPISDGERATFDAVYRRHEATERQQRGVQDGVQLQRAQQASIDRVALGRALIECGFLSFRRRRITPRIPKRKADRFS